jgi:hypothetical protein
MAVTYLITGFSLDRRVLEILDLPPEKFRCVDLIAAEPRETLPHYALRLADRLGFQTGDAVSGLSFGGMVALEISHQCQASRLLLLASCTHPRFIRPLFRASGRLAPWIPDAALHALFQNIPAILRLMGMHTSKNAAFLREVMGSFPATLMRQLPGMMRNWEGCEPSVPYAALHSDQDWLIRPPLHLRELTLLPGKSHLLTVSHTQTARDFLISNSAF